MSTLKVSKSELSSEASNLSSVVSSLVSAKNSLTSALSGVSDYDGIAISAAGNILISNIENAIKDLEIASTNITNYAKAIEAADVRGKDGQEVDDIEFTYSVQTDGSSSGNIKAIWNYFKNKGLSDAAICGILGNISAESGFDPSAIEGNGEGHGLIQWSFGRRESLLATANAQGVDWRDLNFQLDYLWNESVNPNSSYGQKLAAAGFYDSNVSIEKATYEFHRIVEGSGDSIAAIRNKRIGDAINIYNNYKDAVNIGTNSNISDEGIKSLSEIEAKFSQGEMKATNATVTDSGANNLIYTGGGSYGGGSYGGGGSGGGGSGGSSSGSSNRHPADAKTITYDSKTAAEYAKALQELKLKSNFETEDEARQQVVDIAATQLGNTDETEYAKLLGESNGIQWCSEFAVWCAHKSGLVDAGLFPKFAGAADGVRWFKEHGQFQDGSYTPKAGDVIFIGNPNLHHTALVEKVENGKIYTIEGNISDKVVRKVRSIGSSDIYGFGLPDYSKLVTETPSVTI